MPSRPPSACRRPGCPGLVRAGVCSVCGPLVRRSRVEHDERRGTAHERGYDARWRRLRTAHMAAEPLCRMCGKLADLVDHITPILDGGAVLDDNNLQSLCKACHAVKSARDLAKRKEKA